MKKNLDSFDDHTDLAIQNNYLLRSFVAEYLEGLTKVAFVQTYLEGNRDVHIHIHPAYWLASWAFVWGFMIFVLYWILQWGSINENTIVEAWGLSFVGTFLYVIIVQELIIIFVTRVLLV